MRGSQAVDAVRLTRRRGGWGGGSATGDDADDFEAVAGVEGAGGELGGGDGLAVEFDDDTTGEEAVGDEEGFEGERGLDRGGLAVGEDGGSGMGVRHGWMVVGWVGRGETVWGAGDGGGKIESRLDPGWGVPVGCVPVTLQELSKAVRAGRVDTVLVAFPDPFGRLVGKRFRADYFLSSVAKHGTHGCNYLLTVNLEMDPLDGFKVANWDAGFGDFEMRPDLDTLRILPWQVGSALVLCDFLRHDGALVAEAPRSVLRRQLERVSGLGMTCYCASELEFYLFNQTYHAAAAAGYRELVPSSDYRIDYHLMQPTRDEPLMRAIRNGMTEARVPVESSKGEWSRGQHEINFTYAEPLAMADMHVLFKQGVKEIAEQFGKAVTFMAKYAPAEAGNSCHIHMSLWKGGVNLFAEPPGKGQGTKARNAKQPKSEGGAGDGVEVPGSKLFRQFLGGLMKYSPELCLFYGPTINSYKRYQPGSWAPTRMAWATDNRTTGFRVVGHGKGFRPENRMPGADANPYLAFSAMLAAGLAGIEEDLDCGPEYRGNAYVDPKLARLPSSLREATELFERSGLAREAFGSEVVDFYVHHARLEQQAFADAVTDWEKQRYFERI